MTEGPAGPRRVAVVTGASQGIGAGLVDRVPSRRVRRRRHLAHDRGRPPSADYLTVQGDIAAPATARRVVERALDRFGRIDSLVNNAGLFIGKPFTEYTAEDYEAVTSVNLAGFFHITQLAIRQMVAQGGGHVVNVSTSLVDRPDSRRPPRSRPSPRAGSPP